MKQPQWYLVPILLTVLSLLQGKASAQTLDGWHGDTSAFVLRDGILSIAEDASGSFAMIYRGFPDLGDVSSFRMETLMDKPPTTRNTFKWEILSLRSKEDEYGIYIAPTAQGQGVGMYQELPSGTDKLLTALTLPDRLTVWQRLKIFVDKDKTKYRLRVVTPTGSTIKSDWLTSPLEGETVRRMIFTAKFTKNARSHLRWRLPTVSGDIDEGSDDDTYVDVRILSIKSDPSGKVVITLDRSVDTSKAEVHCEGHSPTLRSLSQDGKSIEIDMHSPFVEGKVYTVSVQGLRTEDGHVVNTLSLEISTGGGTLPSEFGEWTGDLSRFVLKDGRLSIHRDAEPPTAQLSLRYGDVDKSRIFYMESRMSRTPTSRNTFQWQVMTYDNGGMREALVVKPDNEDSSVRLYRETLKGEKVSKRTLLISLAVRSPKDSWSDLKISVLREQTGVRLKIVERGGEEQVSELVPLDIGGRFAGEMNFVAKFTKGEKDKLHWKLPEILYEGESVPSPVPPPIPPHSEEKALYISEIMASTPDKGPFEGFKYIELYNPQDTPVSLHTFILRYKNTSYTLPEVSVPPRSYVTLFADGDTAVETLEHSVRMAKFPALSGTFVLQLIGAVSGQVVDRVKFGHKLYGYGFEKGKASVERLSFSGHNDQWRRSDDPRGGTPSEPTKMKPASPVVPNALIINEILLSPPSTGEKYIELHNTTDTPIPRRLAGF